jgi:hypothetical protein
LVGSKKLPFSSPFKYKTMKCLVPQNLRVIPLFVCLAIFGYALMLGGCRKYPHQPKLKIETIATGFKEPIGMELDDEGNLWVAESGTGNNDGKLSVISKGGIKYELIVDFESYRLDNGEVEGPTHLLLDGGILYILGGHGKLYKANAQTLKPGSGIIKAASLGVEDIGTFVLNHDFENETNETHPYNIIKGPAGSMYITDAAANAVIRREGGTGALTVIAEVPGVENPTPVGPPMVQSVPTGLYFDGQNFLVTTLLGFPFPAGKARIYKMSPAGQISLHQDGFTTLVDIAEGDRRGRVVLEHGNFGPTGFVPNSGRLLRANGNNTSVLTDELNRPAGLKQADQDTWYVTSVGDGSVLKIWY